MDITGEVAHHGHYRTSGSPWTLLGKWLTMDITKQVAPHGHYRTSGSPWTLPDKWLTMDITKQVAPHGHYRTSGSPWTLPDKWLTMDITRKVAQHRHYWTSGSPWTLLGKWLSMDITGQVAHHVTSVRPRMDNEIHNVTVIEGHEAILPCVVNNIGRHQVKVVWLDKWKTVLTLNENRIIDDDRFKVDLPRDGQWNLHFDKVKYGDQGMFTCQINTEPAMSQTVALSVIVPPRIISDPIESTLIYREGDRVTLTCNATGMPKPTVRWYRQPSVRGETRESESCTTLPRIGYAGEILQIHNVTRHCGGVYECEADNEVAPSVRKATVVKVKFQPEVVVASERIAQSIGKDTILECTITGYPQAEAAWKFGSKQLSNSEKHKLEVFPYNDDENKLSLYLNIKDIQRSDFGDYFCFASNDMGEASDRMVLEGRELFLDL
ncbi:hypothetical protein Btru_076293 [Bulinus truncatus]|nr:hypothetical protein Btru_076293 [Bulinus truncatus]